MNRRFFLHTSLLAASCLILPAAFGAAGKIGKLDPAEFMKINQEADAKLAAIKPGSEPLSKDDEKLMLEVALGGMMQLELSRVAVKRATSPDVKAIAHAEVEEQTGLSAKLKEIAAAKKIEMPPMDQEKIQKMVAKLETMSGAEFDRAYLKASGIHGHEVLQATMEKVEAKAMDPVLKKVAMTALPLIKTHLQVSKDEESSMG